MDDNVLTDTLCELLGRVPGWRWEPDSTVSTPVDDVRVHYGSIPDKPDRAIGVRVYRMGVDDPNREICRRVQFRIRGRRGAPADADHIASMLATVLTGIVRMRGISEISPPSSGLLGPDKSAREERTENVILTLDNAEATS